MMMTRLTACWLLCLIIYQVFGAKAAFAQDSAIGFVVPLTGSAALMGESLQGVVKLAGLSHFQVRFEDDRCDGKTALSAYLKLRGEGVRVFYMACSGSILAVAPQAKRNGDLILTTYAGSSRIRETGDEVIRLNPDAVSVADGLAKVIGPEDLPVAILYEEQEYASSLAERLSELLGDRVVEKIPYRADATDFGAEILKIKRENPKSVVLIPLADGAARAILEQFKQQHLSQKVLGEVNFCDFPFKASDYGFHGRCVAARFKGLAYEDFLSRYTKLLGHAPAYPFYDAMALDLVKFLDTPDLRSFEPTMVKKKVLAGFAGTFSKYALIPAGEPLSTDEYLDLVIF